LDETIHIKTRFPSARFTTRLAAVEAGGGRLTRFSGDGWLACGDAALSFDPVSGYGMLAAIYQGALASDYVAGALEGQPAAPADYSSRLGRLRATYCWRHRDVYWSERRWRSMPFWSSTIASHAA
jgi:flavin-dependent dehydrogenase